MSDLEYINKMIRNAEILEENSVSELAKANNHERLLRLKRFKHMLASQYLLKNEIENLNENINKMENPNFTFMDLRSHVNLLKSLLVEDIKWE